MSWLSMTAAIAIIINTFNSPPSDEREDLKKLHGLMNILFVLLIC
jgi:hypothetical protein